VQRAKDQGFLSSSAAVTFNRILEEKAFFEAEAAGFFGTNTGSAIPAQFRFGQVVLDRLWQEQECHVRED
jgi:hypothetical protein